MGVQNRWLALLGLLAVGAVALQLVLGSLSIPQAALRAAVVLGVLVVVERVALPVAKSLVGPGKRVEPESSEDGSPPPAAPPTA